MEESKEKIALVDFFHTQIEFGEQMTIDLSEKIKEWEHSKLNSPHNQDYEELRKIFLDFIFEKIERRSDSTRSKYISFINDPLYTIRVRDYIKSILNKKNQKPSNPVNEPESNYEEIFPSELFLEKSMKFQEIIPDTFYGQGTVFIENIEQKKLLIEVNAGSATPEEIADILSDISILYRKMGGSGINLSIEGVKERKEVESW